MGRLCIWGDSGWGGLVRQGKYRDRRFADELVAACVALSARRGWRARVTFLSASAGLQISSFIGPFAV